MKKALSFIIVLAMILSLFSIISASAEIIIEVDDYSYMIDDDGNAAITGYTGSDTDIVIPSELNGYTVAGIYDRAFYDSDRITSVVLPDTVTWIGEAAFGSCDSLTSVTLNSVKYIFGEVFAYCTALESIEIPDSVRDMGSWAFKDCTALTSVTVGKSLPYINYTMFYGCTALKNVTMPDSLTSIGGSAFCGCTDLTDITIPRSVWSIGISAFSGCSGLTSVTLPDSVRIIGESAFDHCASLANVAMTDSVTEIGDRAFFDCTSLKSVTIPGSVTSIGTKAFGYCEAWDDQNDTYIEQITDDFTICGFNNTRAHKYAGANGIAFTSLGDDPDSSHIVSDYSFMIDDDGNAAITGYAGSDTDIVIPSELNGYTVAGIYDRAFYDSDRITSVVLPDTVTWIGEAAFQNCDSLICVSLHSVRYISGYAFAYCTALESIEIPDSVRDMGSWAFKNCTALTSVTVGKSLPYINYAMFYGCTALKNVTMPDSITSIGGSAFCGCTALTDITIPRSVWSIGISAFSDCSGLTSVTLPDSVRIIGESAFDHCASLANVAMTDSVTEIGDRAFFDCTSLKSVTIPGSVTSIGTKAFGYYEGWDTHFTHRIEQTVDNFTIRGYNNTTAHQYAEANCFNFLSLGDDPDSSHIAGDYRFMIDDDGGAVISGYNGSDLNPVIPSELSGYTVTGIGDFAFEDNNYITSVVLPDTVTWIGEAAFQNCDSLICVSLHSVRYISGYAFAFCTRLRSITIPDSVTDIGTSAFAGCKSLTSVTVGKSLSYINYAMFSGCSALKSVTMPDSVTSIGGNAFYYCTALTNITIPRSVWSIGGNAFYGCTGLTSVTIPHSVTNIGDSAFSRCKSLTNVAMTDSVTQIGDQAFYGCPLLKKVTIPGSVTSIGTKAFGYYEIWDDQDDIWIDQTVDGFTICGYNNTGAHKYAGANGFIFIMLVPVIDNVTGVSLDIPEEQGLNVDDATVKEAAGAADILPEGSEVEAVYNIEVTDDGVAVQPVNDVKVQIPCDNPDASVFRQEANGTITNMRAVYQDGYLVFYTNHFSVYIVAEADDFTLGDVDENNRVETVDVTWLLRNSVLMEIPFSIKKTPADADGDGEITTMDATVIQRYLAAMPVNDNIGKLV